MRFFINGRPVERSVSRTLLFGEGVFETFRWRGGPPVLFGEHYRRLARGAGLLAIPVPSESEVMDAVRKAVEAAGVRDARVKVCLISEGAPDFDGAAERARLLVGVAPYTKPKSEVRVHVISFRRSFSPVLSVKTTSRAESLIGRREARSMGFDEGIFLNERGHVTEGCTTNVFWIKGEVMFTPHPRCGLLPGIVRGAVISLAPRIGLHLEECEAPLQELLSADEIFLTNSVIGAARVIEVDGQKTGRNRQLYLRVRGELFRLLGWED